MERPHMDGSATPRPNDRRGLQPLRLGPGSAGSALQWACGALIGLTVLVTLSADKGGATSGEVLFFLCLAAVVGLSQGCARWLPGPISRVALTVGMTGLALIVLMGIDIIGAFHADFLIVVSAVVASGGALLLAAGLSRLSTGRVRIHRVAVI